MFNIGPGELIVILILALVLLGPEKLPEVARTVGKGMRELKRATEDLKDQVETEFYKLDEDVARPQLRRPEGPRVAQERAQLLAPAAGKEAPLVDPSAPAPLLASAPPVALPAAPPELGAVPGDKKD